MSERCSCRGLGPAIAVIEDRGHFVDCPYVIHPGNVAISHVMRFLLDRGYVIYAPTGDRVGGSFEAKHKEET